MHVQMTSADRHEIRYHRRKQQRDERRQSKFRKMDSFDCVFSYTNLYRAYKHCRRGVSWKGSVQAYITQAPLNIYKTYQDLHADRYQSKGSTNFTICERGKIRHIRSISIEERIVQRCLCDNSLVPMLKRKFIFDNGAAIKGKGYSFAVSRTTEHLRRYYRKHGCSGYALLFDFSKFFDRISHDLLKQLLSDVYSDARILKLLFYFIDQFGVDGLGLGSQISQILALSAADKLDHFIKQQLHIREYGRYMDDGYLLHPNKQYLINCMSRIHELCESLHIVLNKRKTQIVKLTRGFIFIKVRFMLTRTGRIIRRINRRSIRTARNKLRVLASRVVNAQSLHDTIQSWISWYGYAKKFNAWATINRIKHQTFYIVEYDLGGTMYA